MEDGRRWRYKEEEEIVPTSPSTSPSSPKSEKSRPKLPKMVSPRESIRNRLNFATSAQVPLSVVPAPFSVQKMREEWRSTLASGAQRPKMQEEWRSALNSGAERWKMREEWGSALNSAIFISSILAFFFFLLWLTTSLTWDKSFLSLNWTQKWGFVV